MSRARVAVLKVTTGQLSVTTAAAEYGYSRRHLHRLLARYRDAGLEGVEPRSRRPSSNSAATPAAVRERIIEIRLQLSKDGLDAGPITIAAHLHAEDRTAPSTSTIRRILHQAGLVVPAPKKRPRSSLRRFQADQPNECWQSDFTHWQLVSPDATSTDVEILDWLDDHSRLLLSLTASTRVTGADVVTTFTANVNDYGLPASTLTDNGVVYTARFVGGRNAFEYLLDTLHIQQKNGHPGHPQTQGKIERFHQTLKKWLAKQPPAATLADLQAQLDRFRHLYNQHRPHRALDARTPAAAYQATPKALPAGSNTNGHFRVRLDHVDTGGKISLRRAGRMHHLGVGYTHRGQPTIVLIDATTATVVHRTTGEVLSTHDIDTDRIYWRNTQQKPGRWPGSQQ